MKKPKLLLINPYIYDFAAYDLWLKPLGLLYLAAVLEENGCDVILLDAMDRWHPDVLNLQKRTAPRSKKYNDGYFYKESVDKPVEFRRIPRHYSRYGMPPELMRKNLEKISTEHRIDMVLITSGMTYWYRGAHEAITMTREFFPDAKILLGGIYATLFYEFAKRHSGADTVFKGESEQSVLRFISEHTGLKIKKEYQGYDDYPFPAYHLYPKLSYAAMMTSRGCPYNCSFCATHEFTNIFKRRNPFKVAEEIEFYSTWYGIKDISFYDDALFVNADHHIKPILKRVIDRRLDMRFHTPNGLFAKLLDADLAELLVQSGFKTIRLSYETKNPERQLKMKKVNDADLESALDRLGAAGFPRQEVVVYLIMGLPYQTPGEVAESIHYVNSLGAKVSLSSFSPIPNTAEWETAVHEFGFPVDQPLLTNKSVYPLKNENFTYDEFERLKSLAITANKKLILADDITELTVSDYNVYA
jgi:radical SAM superfamily enzyme YgiQ (UPF0313 family)